MAAEELNLPQPSDALPAPANTAPHARPRRPYARAAIAGVAALVAACSPDGNASGPPSGTQTQFEDFLNITPPDCGPSADGPAVVLERQPDGSVEVGGVPRNAEEYGANTEVSLVVTTSQPGELDEGYRTRIVPEGSAVIIPSEEIAAVDDADGIISTHYVALPEGSGIDTGSANGVVVEDLVYEAVKQELGIERATDHNIDDLNSILATTISLCSNTRPEDIDSGRGGSGEYTPPTPSPSPSTNAPENTPNPETVHPSEINDIVDELNSEAMEHNLYAFNYGVNADGKVEKLNISVFMELTGLTPEDDGYIEEFERLCNEAWSEAVGAGIPEPLTFTCIGPDNLRFP